MWDMTEENSYSSVVIKVHNLIAQKLGWTDLEQMLLNEGEIRNTKLEKAINLLCVSYKVPEIFK